MLVGCYFMSQLSQKYNVSTPIIDCKILRGTWSRRAGTRWIT